MTEPATIATNTPPRKNQRRSRRQVPKGGTRARVYANALGLGPNIAIGVLDVSECGVRLLLKRDLRPGTEFEVVLETSSRTVKLTAVAVWSVAAANDTFVIGASLSKPLPYADLHHLAKM